MAITYQKAIKEQCDTYAKDPLCRFIGYNTSFGSRMYGTLNDVDVSLCIEAPVAENLMCGLAMGMALEGFKPVICFERHDFMLLGFDAIINHIDKLAWMSGDQFKLPVIIRAIVGGSYPINPGPMHTADYTSPLRIALKHTPVYVPRTVTELRRAWNSVGQTESGAVVVVEYKDDYSKEIESGWMEGHTNGFC